MAISAQEAQIAGLYVGYFGRSTDPAGLAYWVSQLNDGLSPARIAQSFAVQAEATALYPFLANPTSAGLTDFLTSVYSNLFNRTIDQPGLAYWSGQVNAGKPVGGIIADMISGAQGNDLLTVNNRITVGIEYAQAFAAAGKTWTAADLASSKSVLAGVTFDPGTVTAAESKIHAAVTPTPTPAPTPTPTPTPTPAPTPAPTPTPTPTPPGTTMLLTVPNQGVTLNSTAAASLISLTGTDGQAYPSSTYGTVAGASAAGILAISSSAGGQLSAAGNVAATTFNFGTGVVGGTDAVDDKLTYSGFTRYIASSNGDTVTTSANGQSAVGGNGADTFNLAGTGTHTVTGGGGVDFFDVTAGTANVDDLGAGGSNDRVAVATGTTLNAKATGTWMAGTTTTNAATAASAVIDANGNTISVASALGTAGWTLTNSSTTGATMSGSALADIITGNTGADTINGGAGDDAINGGGGTDSIAGGDGIDTFTINTAGTSNISDLGFGGADKIVVGAAGTANATVTVAWTATSGSSNSGAGIANAKVDAAGFAVDLSAITGGTKGWTITNSGAGKALTGSALGDSITGSSTSDTIDGKAGNDILSGGSGGTDSLTGGTGDDLFNVSGANVTITDLGGASSDLDDLKVSGGNVTVTVTSTWAAGASLHTGGTVTIDANGHGVNLLATLLGTQGWIVTNSSATGSTIVGSYFGDTITGGNGADDIDGGDGEDHIAGGSGADTVAAGVGVDRVTIGIDQDTVSLAEISDAPDTLIWNTAFAPNSSADAATVTDFEFGAGTNADHFEMRIGLLHGTTDSTSPVAVASNGTATANGVIYTFNGAGDIMASSTVATAIANAVVALRSGTDFSSGGAMVTGDSLILQMNDGTNTFVFHYVADATAATTSAADLQLMGMMTATTVQAVTGNFI